MPGFFFFFLNFWPQTVSIWQFVGASSQSTGWPLIHPDNRQKAGRPVIQQDVNAPSMLEGWGMQVGPPSWSPVRGTAVKANTRAVSQKPGWTSGSDTVAHLSQGCGLPSVPPWLHYLCLPSPSLISALRPGPRQLHPTLMPAFLRVSSVGLTSACSWSSTPVRHSSSISISRLSITVATLRDRSCTLSLAWT